MVFAGSRWQRIVKLRAALRRSFKPCSHVPIALRRAFKPCTRWGVGSPAPSPKKSLFAGFHGSHLSRTKYYVNLCCLVESQGCHCFPLFKPANIKSKSVFKIEQDKAYWCTENSVCVQLAIQNSLCLQNLTQSYVRTVWKEAKPASPEAPGTKICNDIKSVDSWMLINATYGHAEPYIGQIKVIKFNFKV